MNKKIRWVTKISFATFLLSLLYLLVGTIYSIRFEVVKKLGDVYLAAINMTVLEKSAMVISIIGLISFAFFLFSIQFGEDDEEEEDKTNNDN